MGLADEVQGWIDANWSYDLTVGEWWRRLASAGYAHPSWPAGLGGIGASPAEARIVLSVLAANGVIAPPSGNVGAGLTAPTLLAHGTAEQKRRFVPAIADGREAWCQLFSEPGAGSDLAGLAATAIRVGDDWIVNGQKVWNSAADTSDLGMLLARTDPDQPKHQGISFFLIDMRQAGVEARPLRQMNGLATFCEVFLTDARVPADRLLGPLHGGWRVAQTTLAAERNAVAGRVADGLVPARSGTAGDLLRPVAAVLEEARAAAKSKPRLIRSNAIPWRVMLELAHQSGASAQPVVRQELARYHIQVRVNGWLARRIAAARGQLTGADGSLAKLATSRVCQQSRELGYHVAGPAGMTMGPASPLGGELQTTALGSPATRLGGGSDEIQLNVIGERALGLPREPAVDRDVPFRLTRPG